MKKIFSFLLLLCTGSTYAQTHLEQYINTALNSNETIRQQQFFLDKSLWALKEAKSLFLPNVAFNGTYTLAGGGRTVDIPVGDLMNPIYKTLNQLTGANNFPQIQNQSVLLNPNNFYDVKLHATYPIINAELVYNKKIRSQQYDMQKVEIDIYKRELVKEIKIAYYNYLQATAAIRIYENVLALVKENERINTSLFNNQKVNRTAVVRSNNEVTKITAQLNTAILNQDNARSHFNFLINQPLTTPLLIDSIASVPDPNIINDTAVNKREELIKLHTASAINKNLIGLANSYKIPKLNSFLDVGSQDFDFKVNDKSPYYFFGVSLGFDIFSGGKNKYKVKQAKTDGKAIESQISNIEQQLKLQVSIAANSFNAALVNYNAAVSQVASSEKNYKDELRMYKEGIALYIELLDAQNQLVSAQLQENISLYDTLIKQAEIERANASFIIQ
ncbi:TolC family protein [Pedobacter panaciterrae]|uniref:TolC family protein n=1 Tax=Pedobacter panaciterrae TaxID=363849 RepID=UPI00155DA3AB|nr:TolC family protein [Pedobacter panaciterrae]NQX56222.1 TolC family protein [Pedobacter panaciterrae]